MCLGFQIQQDNMFSHLFLIARYFIYKCRLKLIPPQMTVFLNELRSVLSIEKTIAVQEGKESLFRGKWGRVLTYFSSTI